MHSSFRSASGGLHAVSTVWTCTRRAQARIHFDEAFFGTTMKEINLEAPIQPNTCALGEPVPEEQNTSPSISSRAHIQ